ncbi:MAG: hypothetical protein ACUVT4_11825, partial [Actinomycetota bacterium]
MKVEDDSHSDPGVGRGKGERREKGEVLRISDEFGPGVGRGKGERREKGEVLRISDEFGPGVGRG